MFTQIIEMYHYNKLVEIFANPLSGSSPSSAQPNWKLSLFNKEKLQGMKLLDYTDKYKKKFFLYKYKL